MAAALALIASTCAVAAPSPAHAQRVEIEYNPFTRNRVSTSFAAGLSASGRETYMQLGVGVGYFLADGLQLGVDSSIWLLGTPTFLNVTPGLTYIFYHVPVLKPYVGAFYRHAFVFSATDLDSVGGRAGVYVTAQHTYVGGGLVYEHWLNCNGAGFIGCDEVYPEISFTITF